MQCGSPEGKAADCFDSPPERPLPGRAKGKALPRTQTVLCVRSILYHIPGNERRTGCRPRKERAAGTSPREDAGSPVRARNTQPALPRGKMWGRRPRPGASHLYAENHPFYVLPSYLLYISQILGFVYKIRRKRREEGTAPPAKFIFFSKMTLCGPKNAKKSLTFGGSSDIIINALLFVVYLWRYSSVG